VKPLGGFSENFWNQKCKFCLLRLLLTVCRHMYPLIPSPGSSFRSHSMDVEGDADEGSKL